MLDRGLARRTSVPQRAGRSRVPSRNMLRCGVGVELCSPSSRHRRNFKHLHLVAWLGSAANGFKPARARCAAQSCAGHRDLSSGSIRSIAKGLKRRSVAWSPFGLARKSRKPPWASSWVILPHRILGGWHTWTLHPVSWAATRSAARPIDPQQKHTRIELRNFRAGMRIACVPLHARLLSEGALSLGKTRIVKKAFLN